MECAHVGRTAVLAAKPAIAGAVAGPAVHLQPRVRFFQGHRIGAHNFGAHEVAERNGRRFELAHARRADDLPGALVRDGPEFFGTRPYDPSFGPSADRRKLVPASAVVGVQAGSHRPPAFFSPARDQQAAVRCPKADFADHSERNPIFVFGGRSGGRGRNLSRFPTPMHSFNGAGRRRGESKRHHSKTNARKQEPGIDEASTLREPHCHPLPPPPRPAFSPPEVVRLFLAITRISTSSTCRLLPAPCSRRMLPRQARSLVNNL